MRAYIKYFSLLLIILLSSLLYCYFNYQFWNHLNTGQFKYLTEYKSAMISGYRGNQIIVNKEFKNHLKQIDELASKIEAIQKRMQSELESLTARVAAIEQK